MIKSRFYTFYYKNNAQRKIVYSHVQNEGLEEGHVNLRKPIRSSLNLKRQNLSIKTIQVKKCHILRKLGL